LRFVTANPNGVGPGDATLDGAESRPSSRTSKLVTRFVSRSVTITAAPWSSKPTWAGLVTSALSDRDEPEIGVRCPSPSTRRPDTEFGAPLLRT
jgi:hypothetical protein